MSTVDELQSGRPPERAWPRGAVFPAAARSEWTKIRSLRSTSWTLLLAVLATVAVATFVCVKYAQMYPEIPPADRQGFDATLFSLTGVYLAQVAFGALGVLVITSEYGTGAIRSSLAAVPRRRIFLAAKAVVFATTALVVGEVMAFSAFWTGQAILAQQHIGVSLGDPGVARAVAGAGLYLTGVGLLALGIGGIVRNTAGALSAFFGVLFAANVVVDLLPTTWHDHVINYLPANAGSQVFTIYPSHGALTPWAGFAVFCAYPVVALTVAFVLVGRRDS